MHLAIHILVPVILGVLVNGFIFSQGWDSGSQPRSPLLPPGIVIGIVWLIIFALLGFAHHRLYPSVASYVIVCAIVFCLAYPFLTQGLQQKNARILNLGTLFIAFAVMLTVATTVRKRDTMPTWAVMPFLAWASYVNVVDAIE